jgi:NADH-quinone oxidoreductase subunit C
VRKVTADGWLAEVQAAAEEGYGCFDWLGCVDEIGRRDTLRVVLSLRDLDRPAEPELLLEVELPRDAAELDSIRGIFAGAAWHEREVAELFGVRFAGGEGRRLLLGPSFEGVPMRKDAVLGARTGLSWPGAKEPGETDAAPARRRMVPPGVPDPAVWGDRDPEAADPAAGEVAESAVGGRPRGRRP